MTGSAGMQGIVRVMCGGVLLPLLISCGGSAAGGAAADLTAGAGSGATALAPAGAGLSLGGEHFTVRTLIDRRQGNLPVFTLVAPDKWRDRSEVVWDFAHTSNPVSWWMTVENPGDAQAVYFYANLDLFWLPPTPIYRIGQNYMGQIYARPLGADAALAEFARQVRGRQAGFQLVGTKPLPGLAAALGLPPYPTQNGIGLKVRYKLDGKPVEEEFYAVYYKANIPYDGPQGRSWQTNWGLIEPHSFRAAVGVLDKRREVFAAIPKSIRRNPAWTARLDAVNKYLKVQYDRQMQAGYDQIAAAGRLSRQLSANSDAMLASIDASLQAGRSNSAGGASARSSMDKFDDYVRGVDTTDDPYYGTSQHSTNESYHWTDGYGGYRNTNDPGANPNQTEAGNWTLMQSSR